MIWWKTTGEKLRWPRMEKRKRRMGARMSPDGSNIICQREQQIHMEWEQYPTPSLRELMLNHRLRVEQLSHHHYLRHQSNSILFLLILCLFSIFLEILDEFVIEKFQPKQELLGLLPGFYREFLAKPGSSWVNQ